MSSMSLQIGHSFPGGLVLLIQVLPHAQKEITETPSRYTLYHSQFEFSLYPISQIHLIFQILPEKYLYVP